MALGVDPLNDKEVHIWHGKHGVDFQLAYTLMARWVRNMKGGHTEPRFTDLTPKEKELRGLAENYKATRASRVMLSDIPKFIALSQAGFSPEEAREHFTVTGLGTVRAEDWASPYFAPNGHSKEPDEILAKAAGFSAEIPRTAPGSRTFAPRRWPRNRQDVLPKSGAPSSRAESTPADAIA
jgi:hypothetical protein